MSRLIYFSIEYNLEPATTFYKWLFQLDDSQSLHRKWLFHQTSLYKWLFGVPGIYTFDFKPSIFDSLRLNLGQQFCIISYQHCISISHTFPCFPSKQTHEERIEVNGFLARHDPTHHGGRGAANRRFHCTLLRRCNISMDHLGVW